MSCSTVQYSELISCSWISNVLGIGIAGRALLLLNLDCSTDFIIGDPFVVLDGICSTNFILKQKKNYNTSWLFCLTVKREIAHKNFLWKNPASFINNTWDMLWKFKVGIFLFQAGFSTKKIPTNSRSFFRSFFLHIINLKASGEKL